jgi:hypothetical protein
MSLIYIAQQLTIYGGSVLLVFGIIGNAMNIWIFSSVRNYRTIPCTFYFLVVSIHNIIYILINLPIRIFSTAHSVDLTRNSLIWCKTQSFFIGYLGLTSFTCSCLTTVDQFLATSRSVYLRRFSNIRLAYRLVLIVMIVWCFHAIPVLVFYNISPVTGKCGSTDPSYSFYLSMYILLFQCLIPVLIMVLFGYLTYRNIQMTRVLAEQHADRQLVRMILIQLVLVVISMTPYGAYTIYNLITSKIIKDSFRLQEESFAATVFIIVSYFYYVVCLIKLIK